MTKTPDLSQIVKALVCAANGRTFASLKPWNYGWSQPDYRRCPTAAIVHDEDNSVTLQPEAVQGFEEAMRVLLQFQLIRRSYEEDELWSLVASLVGTLSMQASPADLATAIESGLKRILNPPDSLVVLPVANIAQPLDIIEVGPLIIGPFARLEKRIRTKTGRRPLTMEGNKPWWMPAPDAEPRTAANEPVLLAYTGCGQLGRATDDAEQALEDLVSIALMLQPDLNALSLFSLRGDVNRPGTRGLVIDRQSLFEMSTSAPQLKRELTSPVYVDGVLGPNLHWGWYSENPFPLEELLTRSDTRAILLGRTAILQRLRVAARWHGKAHWASDLSDAVLALGISFDSMLTEEGPSPGRVISERFALLDPDPDQRRRRYRKFQGEYYAARSAIAHGARGSSVAAELVRAMAQEARWVFRQILDLSQRLGISTEKEYNQMYESLKWGESLGQTRS